MLVIIIYNILCKTYHCSKAKIDATLYRKWISQIWHLSFSVIIVTLKSNHHCRPFVIKVKYHFVFSSIIFFIVSGTKCIRWIFWLRQKENIYVLEKKKRELKKWRDEIFQTVWTKKKEEIFQTEKYLLLWTFLILGGTPGRV